MCLIAQPLHYRGRPSASALKEASEPCGFQSEFLCARSRHFDKLSIQLDRYCRDPILHLTTRAADHTESDALNLPVGAREHAFEGLSLADGQPIALFRSIFPTDRFPDLCRLTRETHSVKAALAACGVTDYTRASTRLNTIQAGATQALHFRLTEGAPFCTPSTSTSTEKSVPSNLAKHGSPETGSH